MRSTRERGTRQLAKARKVNVKPMNKREAKMQALNIAWQLVGGECDMIEDDWPSQDSAKIRKEIDKIADELWNRLQRLKG